jgi:gliding motility-associated-like protein
MNYEYLGNSEYLITLRVYRDCGPTNTNNTGFDEFATVTVYSGVIIYLNLGLPLAEAQVGYLPVELDDPCFTLPPELCVEEAVYTQVVYLPEIVGGYDIVYQRCCRNPSIINIFDPSNTGATFTTHIPGTNQTNTPNSNPVFEEFPPVAICVGQALDFNHSATDLDGDSLVYSFCNPFLGGTAFDPQPSPALAPPYIPVTWNPGYSTAYPIASDPVFTINPETGLLSGTPNAPGQYVVGICVAEYRNGVLLSTTNRDFQFNVVTCIPEVLSAIQEQQDPCSDFEVTFDNQSLGGQSFYWDFGVEGSDTDISTEFEPTFTYPEFGSFTVMLVVNPGFVCADTTYQTFNISPELNLSAAYELDDCNEDGIYLNFSSYIVEDLDNVIYDWDFGNNASPESSEDIDPQQVYFDDLGSNITVTVSANFGGCIEEVEIPVEIPLPPTALIALPDTLTCSQPQVVLDGTESGQNLSYNWSTSEGNIVSEGNSAMPVINQPGSYILTVTDANGCSGTESVTVPYIGEGFIDPDAVRIPNVFSPNNDKVNDTFFPYLDGAAGVDISSEFDSFSMKVYSRWGNLIFESSENKLVWDGKNDGGDVSSEGVYFYIITFSNFCETEYTREINGVLSLKY